MGRGGRKRWSALSCRGERMGEREREKKKQKKASFEIQWSLGSGHPKVYLAQFGSSMIIEQTSQQKHPPPAHPMEKYTFQYLCNNLDRISLLRLCK